MLHRSVTKRTDTYIELLGGEGVDFVRGLYLLGWVALGDYQDGRSDIDFAALLDGPLDGERVERLGRVHDALATLEGPSFDGFYLEPHRLHEVPGSTQHAPFSLDGSFHPDAPCFQINPVTWALWSRHGIASWGPPPSDLGIATDQSALREFQIANLQSYWREWVTGATSHLARKSATDQVDASLMAWSVLGVARIACTLSTGRIVSKSDAGRWALKEYGPDWQEFISDALGARRGETTAVSVDRFRGALEYMRHVIASCRRRAR